MEDVVRACDMVDESAADNGETASTMLYVVTDAIIIIITHTHYRFTLTRHNRK